MREEGREEGRGREGGEDIKHFQAHMTKPIGCSMLDLKFVLYT